MQQDAGGSTAPTETTTHQVSNEANEAIHKTPQAKAFTCLVVGDRTVCVHDAIVRHGGQILQSVGWTPFRNRRSAVVEQVVSSLPMLKPTVLWIHLDSRQAYAQNPIHKTSVKQLAVLAAAQEQAGRMVVLEGSYSEVNWHSAAKQLLGPTAKFSTIHWCGLGIKLGVGADAVPLHSAHAVSVRNAPSVEPVPCNCGKRRMEKHDHDLGSHFDQFMVWFLQRLGLSSHAVPRTLADSPRRQLLVERLQRTVDTTSGGCSSIEATDQHSGQAPTSKNNLVVSRTDHGRVIPHGSAGDSRLSLMRGRVEGDATGDREISPHGCRLLGEDPVDKDRFGTFEMRGPSGVKQSHCCTVTRP